MPANNTQTITAPLHFHGRDVPEKGDLIAENFLRELKGRIEGQAIGTDKEKLNFATACMQGDAYAFYAGLKYRDEFTYDFFKKQFRVYYNLPGSSVEAFDVSRHHNQRIDENPQHFLNRITLYVTSSFPSTHFCQFFPSTTTIFTASCTK